MSVCWHESLRTDRLAGLNWNCQAPPATASCESCGHSASQPRFHQAVSVEAAGESAFSANEQAHPRKKTPPAPTPPTAAPARCPTEFPSLPLTGAQGPKPFLPPPAHISPLSTHANPSTDLKFTSPFQPCAATPAISFFCSVADDATDTITTLTTIRRSHEQIN